MTGTETRFFRNGVLIDSPRNWKELEIECNWEDRKESGELNLPTLNFVGEEATNIKLRFLDGLSGGVGFTEGDELKIQFGDSNNTVFEFEGMIDYSSDLLFMGENEVRVEVKKLQGLDWLSEVADGFSFASMYDEGIVKDSDFIKVPYVLNYIPDNTQLILLSLYSFLLAKELAENVMRIFEGISEGVNAATPSVGVGVGVGAVAVTTYDIGDIIWASAKIAIKIGYTIAIGVALYRTLQDLIEQILPAKRNHLGMNIKRMFELGCQKTNLTLNSNLLNTISDWCVIPSKFAKGGEPPKGEKETGYPTNSDSIYTFGDLIRVCSIWFNADYKIINGVFYFEQERYFDNLAQYVIPSTYTDQEKLQNHLGFNTNELKSNFLVKYEFDIQDQNTLENQEGRVFQLITEPIVVKNPKLKTLKGLEEIVIPFSLGVEKDKLTNIESTLKFVLQRADLVLNLYGKPAISNKITDRLNCLSLSSHFLSIPKVVVMQGSKLKPKQRQILSASKIFNNYHFTKSFVPINNDHNQWRKIPEKTIPFSKEDFVILSQSNYCFTENGQKARIDYLKWNPYKGIATIKGRVKEIYTNNLKIRTIE
jgi:hypothetical protein